MKYESIEELKLGIKNRIDNMELVFAGSMAVINFIDRLLGYFIAILLISSEIYLLINKQFLYCFIAILIYIVLHFIKSLAITNFFSEYNKTKYVIITDEFFNNYIKDSKIEEWQQKHILKTILNEFGIDGIKDDKE